MGPDRTKLRWNGWGWAAHKDDVAQRDEVWAWLATELGMPALLATPPQPLEHATLPESKLPLQHRQELSGIVGADQVRDSAYERAFHALGRSYYDLLRLRTGDLSTAPDAVVYPRGTEEVLAVLAFAARRQIAVVPYGGGTSVVGGVTAARGDFPMIITLDLSQMDRVIEIDPVSRTAVVEAGIYGPALENVLKTKGLTLGHTPQSFEFSTLGGWIGHHGAGQGANIYGRARDWLVSAKLATPEGLLDTGAVPASAVGPALKDLVIGSEGIFGIVTEARLRLHRLPQVCEYRGYLFPDFESGAAAIRAAQQDGCGSAMLRLSDVEETRFQRDYASVEKANGVLSQLRERYLRLRGAAAKPCLLVAGFEGEVDEASFARKRFAQIAERFGGLAAGRGVGEQWRQTRFQAPYLRDSLLDRGVGVETIETAAGWSKLGALYTATRTALETATRETAPREGAHGIVMCHISRSYRDGAALYFTVVFPRSIDGDIEQWKMIKSAATEAIIAQGGTLSHHHGVGVTHLPWMKREKGPLSLEILRAVKTTLDPEGVMNPGKLIP